MLDKIITSSLLFIQISIYVIFFVVLDTGDKFYFDEIQSQIDFSDIVYTQNVSENTYEYFDFSNVRPKFSGHLLNVDVYIDKEKFVSDDLLSINWKLKKRSKLINNQALISINVAEEHNIKIGDTIYIQDNDYIIVDFLPKYDGFNPKRNRLGVLLISESELVSDSTNIEYMYFNNDINATFNNSYYVRSDDYFSYQNQNIYISIFFVTNLAIVLFLYLSSNILREKIKVLYKEGYSISKIILITHIDKTVLNVLMYIVPSGIIYILYIHDLYGGKILSITFLIFISIVILNELLAFYFVISNYKKQRIIV